MLLLMHPLQEMLSTSQPMPGTVRKLSLKYEFHNGSYVQVYRYIKFNSHWCKFASFVRIHESPDKIQCTNLGTSLNKTLRYVRTGHDIEPVY